MNKQNCRYFVAIIAIIGLFVSLQAVALSYNQNIVAIFGSGNPDSGWTTDTGGGLTVALRAKNREDANTLNVNGVYSEPVGLQAPNNNRARWNWEVSASSSVGPLSNFDFYVGIDSDSSGCVVYSVVPLLTTWSDNSYGDATTLNGQGQEGLASAFPNATVVQQSQNLVFAGGNPNIDATWNYTLYAVMKNAGPNGVPIVSTAITVIVGTGGLPCPDADGDGIPDNVDQCSESSLIPFVDVNGNEAGVTSVVNTVDTNGCSLQDEVLKCLTSSKNHGDYVSCIVALAKRLYDAGLITRIQYQEMVVGAAKSKLPTSGGGGGPGPV